MKNTIIMMSIIALFIAAYFAITSKQDQEQMSEEQIEASLKVTEITDEYQEFQFILKNITDNVITLQFQRELEYNIGISALDDQGPPEKAIEYEHLNLGSPSGRILELEPNDEIKYIFIVRNLPLGRYEILIQDDRQYGGLVRKEFTVR